MGIFNWSDTHSWLTILGGNSCIPKEELLRLPSIQPTTSDRSKYVQSHSKGKAKRKTLRLLFVI